MPHLQREDGRQAKLVSGLEPMGFGAQKLAVLPAGLVMLSLDVSRQSHCWKEGQGAGLRSSVLVALVSRLPPPKELLLHR